jgi:hypothetical protein
MGVAAIIGIIIGIIAVPVGTVSPDALAEFERLKRHIGRDVVVIDGTGIVMEGRLLAARDTEIALGFGGRVQPLAAADIARVDRQKDSWVDGLVKGLVIGGLLGGITKDARWMANSMAIYGGLGFLLDYRHDAREPIYRARDPRAVQIGATVRWGGTP